MRLLITGGAGFIGQHVAQALSDHELTALDVLLPQVHLDPAASASEFPGTVVRGDVADPRTWAELRPADAVVHLAAETGTGQSMYQQKRYKLVNVTGSRLAARAAQRWTVPLVTLSSRAVYGEGRYACPRHEETAGGRCCERGTPQASREDDPHHPVSVYGRTKSLGEAAIRNLTVPVTVIRPQNVIGPGQALHNPYTGVLAAFLARLREGLPLQMYGDGRQTRDFVHVADVAALIRWCVEHPPEVGEPRTLNAGTGVRTTLLELAKVSITIHTPARTADWERLVEAIPVTRAGDIAHACADLSRLTAAGAPLPVRSSQDAIAAFIRWGSDRPGARASAWDDALTELAGRGLAEGPVT